MKPTYLRWTGSPNRGLNQLVASLPLVSPSVVPRTLPRVSDLTKSVLLGLFLLCCSCAGHRSPGVYGHRSFANLNISDADVLVSLPDNVAVTGSPDTLVAALGDRYNQLPPVLLRALGGYLSGRLGLAPSIGGIGDLRSGAIPPDSVRLRFLPLCRQRGECAIERYITFRSDTSGVAMLEVLAADSLVSVVRVWNRRFLLVVKDLTLTGKIEPQTRHVHVMGAPPGTPSTYGWLAGQAYLWDTDTRSLKWRGVITADCHASDLALCFARDMATIFSTSWQAWNHR